MALVCAVTEPSRGARAGRTWPSATLKGGETSNDSPALDGDSLSVLFIVLAG
jgi:hypothetical protein